MTRDASEGPPEPPADPRPEETAEPVGAAAGQTAASGEAQPEETAAQPEETDRPSGRRRTGLVVALAGVVVVALLCVFGGLVVAGAVRGDVPQAGECMTGAADPNDMTVVECGDQQAEWRVLGTDGELTRAEFSALTEDDDVCQAHPGTEQALWVTEAWWGVDDDTVGEVVCLEPTAEQEAGNVVG